jgi:hypothetical protein
MCTVTFFPQGRQGYILTSNRDEKRSRPLAEPPRRYSLPSGMAIFPKDPQAQGTWIAMDNSQLSLCLLNGAFTRHVANPPYRRSRGLVLLDFFNYRTATAFISAYNFTGIEPFTLLVLQSAAKLSLVEIRWDGTLVHLLPRDAGSPHIWSSATLYPPGVQLLREQWFARFRASKAEHCPAGILQFHRSAGREDKSNALCMVRENDCETVSITSIRSDDSGDRSMTYLDLVRETHQTYRIFC